jgi:hypothetical protein
MLGNLLLVDHMGRGAVLAIGLRLLLQQRVHRVDNFGARAVIQRDDEPHAGVIRG